MSERKIDSTELVALTEQTFDPAVMFDPMKVETLLALIEEKAMDFEADINTKPGQDKFRSQAFNVAKIKTAWITEGKDQNRAINIEVKERNAQCNKIDDRLSAVQAKARQPLTDLENAIKIEEAEHSRLMLMLGERKNTPSDLSVPKLASLLDLTKAIEITGDILGDNYSAATVAKEQAVNSLQEKLGGRIQHEKDQAELAVLREEKAKQEEAATKERIEKEQAARDEQIRKDAEAKAKREEEQRSKAESERVEREKAEEAEKLADAERRIEEEKASKAAAIAVAQKEERARIEKEQEAKEEEERVERQKAAVISANKNHRDIIDNDAKEALIKICGLTAVTAAKVVKTISNGNIPKTSINY